MHAVDSEAAVTLLQLEGSHFPERKTGEVLSNLQLRCMEAITDSWELIDAPSLCCDLNGVNPHLLTCAFSKVAAKAECAVSRVASKAKNDLKFARKQLIPRVQIKAAGGNETNGIYTRFSEDRNGFPIFIKEPKRQFHSIVQSPTQ